MTNTETNDEAAAVAEQGAHVAPEKASSKRGASQKKGAPKAKKSATRCSIGPPLDDKGGKSREIPVRHNVEQMIAAYIDAARLRTAPRDAPLFRAARYARPARSQPARSTSTILAG